MIYAENIMKKSIIKMSLISLSVFMATNAWAENTISNQSSLDQQSSSAVTSQAITAPNAPQQNLTTVSPSQGGNVQSPAPVQTTQLTSQPVATTITSPNVTVSQSPIGQSSGAAITNDSTKKSVPQKKYIISKGTLYNQLAYDFHKKGYKTVWKLSFNPSFTYKEYNSVPEEVSDALVILNKSWGGSYEDGDQVLGFICPLKKEVQFVYSSNAMSVVDSNGVGCDMVTPVSSNNDGSNGSAANNNNAGSNYFQSGNVLGGPMIVNGQQNNQSINN